MREKIDRLSKYSFYLAVFVSPFFFIPSFNFGFFEVLLLISAFFLLLSQKEFVFPDRVITFSLCLILFGFLISIYNAWDIVEAVKFPLQFTFVICILFPLVFTHLDSWERVYRATLALCGSLVVLVSYGIYYYFAVGVTFDRHRWTLFYSNPNTLANVVFFLSVICLFMFFYHYYEAGWNLVSTIFLSVSVISMFIILRTLSRRAILSLLLVTVFILVTKSGRDHKLSVLCKRAALFLPLSIGMVSFTYILGHMPEGILIRVEETINFSSDGSTSSRIIQHQVGIRSLSEYWLVGTGYNNFAVASHHAVTSEQVANIESSGDYPRVHNAWLNPYIEGGIFAGVGATVLFTSLIQKTVQIWINGIKGVHLIGFGYILSSCVFVLTMMFGTLTNIRFYWLMIAISFAVASLIGRDLRVNDSK